MNYSAWTKRASEFIRSLNELPGDVEIYDSIEPPDRDDYFKEWLASDRCRIPPELKDFISTASRRCLIGYTWSPPIDIVRSYPEYFLNTNTLVGGGDFCEAAGYHAYDSRALIRHFPENALPNAAEDKTDRPDRLVPVMELSNGDYVCLELDSEHVAGQVFYVSTSDPSQTRPISPGFDEYLSVWEKMCYLHPTRENLSPWLYANSAYLNPDEAKAARLRELLQSTKRDLFAS